MPRIAYISRKFTPERLAKIEWANAVCEEYARMGYVLTLRQLYYQGVARGHLPNRQTEYENLGSLINDARLAGLIDWDHLEDRTRNLQTLAHWSDPAEIIDAAARSYRVDLWARQPYYAEVWIEKDALIGVLEGVCRRNDVAYFSCRGYTSQSEVWRAAQRLIGKSQEGPQPGRRPSQHGARPVYIIHLGDHDPSGIDMTRDIFDRLDLFMRTHGNEQLFVQRIALNYDQVEQYDPPPNPAKLTDSRARAYVTAHGYESWELDALSPPVIDGLIQDVLTQLIDPAIWQEDVARMERERERIEDAAAWFRETQENDTEG